jgi:hypothetical protein
VKADKGTKVRYTLSAAHMENTSNAYPKAYKPFYGLFEGHMAEPYSARSVQVGLRKEVAKARPNPAMQRMLGQKECKTTELHSHESTQGVQQIKVHLTIGDGKKTYFSLKKYALRNSAYPPVLGVFAKDCSGYKRVMPNTFLH